MDYQNAKGRVTCAMMTILQASARTTTVTAIALVVLEVEDSVHQILGKECAEGLVINATSVQITMKEDVELQAVGTLLPGKLFVEKNVELA